MVVLPAASSPTITIVISRWENSLRAGRHGRVAGRGWQQAWEVASAPLGTGAGLGGSKHWHGMLETDREERHTLNFFYTC